MHFAYSSNAYLNYTLEETVRRIAAAGYEGLELLADVPHAWPAGLLESQKADIRRCITESGLAISNVNAFMMNAVADPRQPYWHPSWIESDPHYRAVRREHTKRSLQLAADLGAPSIQTEPGGPLEDGASRKAALTTFYDEFMPCVHLAEEVGVSLLIEPEPGLLIERFEQYPRIRRPRRFAGGRGSISISVTPFVSGRTLRIGSNPFLRTRGITISRISPQIENMPT